MVEILINEVIFLNYNKFVIFICSFSSLILIISVILTNLTLLNITSAFKHSLLYIIYSLFASKLTKIYYIITFISLNFLIVNSASYSILTFSYTWSPFS